MMSTFTLWEMWRSHMMSTFTLFGLARGRDDDLDYEQ